MAVERTAEQTDPSRLLPSRRSLLRVLTGGALAATFGTLAFPPDSQPPQSNRSTTTSSSLVGRVIRYIERLSLPPPAEAASPTLNFDSCGLTLEIKPRALSDKLTENNVVLTAESIFNPIPNPVEASGYAIDTCGPDYHVAERPDIPLYDTQLYFVYAPFPANRASDLAVLSTGSNPAYDERLRALTMAVSGYDRHWTGGREFYGKLDLGNKTYLDMGSSDSYSDTTKLFDACLEQTQDQISLLKYQPGRRFPIFVYVYLTSNADDISRFKNAGRLRDGFGAVLYGSRQISDLSLANNNNKLSIGASVVLMHEIYHAKGLPHKPDTIMDANVFKEGNLWILTYSDQISRLCGGPNRPDTIPIESLNKTSSLAGVLNGTRN